MSTNKNSEIITKLVQNILENRNKNCVPSSTDIDELIKIILEKKFPYFINQLLCDNIDSKFGSHFLPANTKEIDGKSDDDLWIFGYGSLIWKVDFPFETCKSGYICGYERKFYQNSIDHRGVPENPGRVVTCIPSNNDSRVYGMAYKISSELKNEVLNHLDYREKNGYERCFLKFYSYPESESDEVINVLIYLATEDNESYAGHISDINKIVEQIYWAKGPSGHNRDYVYNLSKAMRLLFPDVRDGHLFQIEKMLRQRQDCHSEIYEEMLNKLRLSLEKMFEKYSGDEADLKILDEIENLIEIVTCEKTT